MGQYAAMTGGMPSTAAMTAAQQAGDYYAAQMTDKIPELYKLAYSMYADEANRNLSELSAMRGIYGDYYNQYKDRYGMLGDALSRATAERSYADTRADKAAKDAYDYAMATGDYSYLRDLGLDTSYLEKQRDKEMAALDKPELSLAEVNAAIKAGNTAPNVLKAWEYYYGAPYEGPTGTPYTGPYNLVPEDDGDDNAVRAGGSDAEIISPPLIGYQNRDLYKEFAGQGVSDGAISSPGQLSPTAQRIENTIASFAMGGNTKDAQLYAADAVTEALQNGEITPEEAEYFANMFGF